MLSPPACIISSRMECGWASSSGWGHYLSARLQSEHSISSGQGSNKPIVIWGLRIMVTGMELQQFQRKKSLLTCCRAQSSFLWQTVLSLLRNHKNDGKVPGIFGCFHLETCPKVISQCENKSTHRNLSPERCCLWSHSTPKQVQLKHMTLNF